MYGISRELKHEKFSMVRYKAPWLLPRQNCSSKPVATRAHSNSFMFSGDCVSVEIIVTLNSCSLTFLFILRSWVDTFHFCTWFVTFSFGTPPAVFYIGSLVIKIVFVFNRFRAGSRHSGFTPVRKKHTVHLKSIRQFKVFG